MARVLFDHIAIGLPRIADGAPFLSGMLGGIPYAERGARFRCVVALAWPHGRVVSAEGEVRGRIAAAVEGSGGFGYDPVFIPEGFDRTFGEMNDAEKRSLSHRARAADEIIHKMLDFIGV